MVLISEESALITPTVGSGRKHPVALSGRFFAEPFAPKIIFA